MVEEVIVETIEAPSFIIRENAVLIGVLRGDARMIMPSVVRVLYEQHIVDYAEQRIADTVVLLRGLHLLEVGLHLSWVSNSGFSAYLSPATW